MVSTALISSIVTLFFGLIIFLFPKALRILVGGYLIIIGILQIVGALL